MTTLNSWMFNKRALLPCLTLGCVWITLSDPNLFHSISKHCATHTGVASVLGLITDQALWCSGSGAWGKCVWACIWCCSSVCVCGHKIILWVADLGAERQIATIDNGTKCASVLRWYCFWKEGQVYASVKWMGTVPLCCVCPRSFFHPPYGTAGGDAPWARDATETHGRF